MNEQANNASSSYKAPKLTRILLIVALALAGALVILHLISLFRGNFAFVTFLLILVRLLGIGSVVVLFLSVINEKMKKLWLFGILGLLAKFYLEILIANWDYPYHFPVMLFIPVTAALAIHYYLKGKYVNSMIRMIAAASGAAVAAVSGLIMFIVCIVNLIRSGNPYFVLVLFTDICFSLFYVAIFGAIVFYAPYYTPKKKAAPAVEQLDNNQPQE